MNQAFNMDCLDGMKQYPDKYFDLAVVDPPYGCGATDNEFKGAIVGRFGGHFGKYHLGDEASAERERERERESCELHGGDMREWDKRKRGRFGGLFDKYHISGADGRNMGSEVSDGERGYL